MSKVVVRYIESGEVQIVEPSSGYDGPEWEVLDVGLPPEDGRAYRLVADAWQVVRPRTGNYLWFVSLFSSDEIVAAFASADPMVRFAMSMATGADYIDLDDPRTVGGLMAMIADGILTEARAQDVLAGIPQ